LTGANTYTGGTTVNNGTLQLGHNSALGTQSVQLNGGVLGYNSGVNIANQVNLNASGIFSVASGTATQSGDILDLGTNGIQKIGGGTLVLDGSNNYLGSTSVLGGTLRLGNIAALPGLTDMNVSLGATLDINGSNIALNTLSGQGSVTNTGGVDATVFIGIAGFTVASSTFAGVISDGPTNKTALGVETSGIFTLIGANTYTGSTTICDCATLQIGDGGFTGSITSNIVNNNLLIFNRLNNHQFDNTISDGFLAGRVEKLGAGTLILTGNNTYSNGTRITAGTLQANNANAVGTGTVTLNGGAFQAGADGLTFTNNFAINPTGGSINTNGFTMTLSGVIANGAGPGSLTKNGAGTLILTNTNTYTGDTNINEGILQLGNGGATGSIMGGTIVIANNATLAVNRSDTLTISNLIGGDGSLVKNGAGALILPNGNSFTGGTTINAGTVAIDHNLALGGGMVTLNGGRLQPRLTDNLVFSNQITLTAAGGIVSSNDLTFTLSGNISGAGALTKQSNGTLILTGAATHLGGTVISQGTLQLGTGGGIVGDIVIDGTSTLAVNRTDDLSLDGIISGTGNLTKTGNALLFLGGNNTFSGGTTINGGTIQLGHDNALGTGALTVLGSTLALNDGIVAGNNIDLQANLDVNVATGTGTLGGVISETGGPFGLAKTGAGTLILTGANTYTGTTTVSEGILQIGTLALQGALGGAVVNNATLDLVKADTSALTSLTNNGAGVRVFNSTTLGGATVINNQVMSFFNTSSAGTANITNSNLLNFLDTSTAGNATITTGNGGTTNFVQTSNPGQAAFIIGAGGLVDMSGTTGPANNGQLTAGSIASSGTLATGTNTLTVNGNVTFNAGSQWTVTITPVSGARILADTITINGGTVAITGTGGTFQPNTNYIVATGTNGVTGTFDGVTFAGTVNNARNPHFIYVGNDIIFVLDQGSISSLLPPNASQNQKNVANALDNFLLGGGDLGALANLFNLTQDGLLNALTQLSGESANGLTWSTFQAMAQFLGVTLDPFVDSRGDVNGPALAFGPNAAGLPSDVAAAYAAAMPTKAPPAAAGFAQRWSLWGSAYGGHNKTSGDVSVGSNDLTARSYGFAAGADYRYSPNTILGFAIAGGGTSWSLANSLGGGGTDALHVGVYGSHRFAGAAYVSGAFGYAHHWVKTDRSVTSPVAAQLKADFGADVIGGRLESGYRFAMRTLGLTPYAALQAIRVSAPAYSETVTSGSAAAALSYASNTATTTRTELGLWLDSRHLMSGGQVLALRGRAAWAHNWFDDPALAASFQTLPGTSFIVSGAAPAKDAALLSAAAEYRFGRGWSLLGKLDGEFASGSRTYAGTATLRRTW
jgi:autotransporter-associated beta strand protein